MGALDTCYSAPCNFFVDESGYPNRITWYRVPDDRPYYEGTTAFWPRTDELDLTEGSAYELRPRAGSGRRWYNGYDAWGKPGTHVDGDADDFAGLSLKAKYSVGGAPPTDPCPTIEILQIKIGVDVQQVVIRYATGDAALALAAEDLATRSTDIDAALALAVDDLAAPPAEDLDASLALAAEDLAAPPAEDLDASLAVAVDA